MKKILVSSLVCLAATTALNAANCIMVKDLNVQFKNDSTIYMDSSEMKEIREFAQFLNDTKLYTIIEGHTSASAPAGYNYELSSRRAVKVRSELIRLGVNPAQIKAMGFGETTPLYDNSTSSGEAMNRRVIAEVFNSKSELNTYLSSEKNRIASIKYSEQ